MQVQGYHIHVYCKPSEIAKAQVVRESMISELKVIEGTGPVRSGPVGPHPLPMFEGWFQPEGLNTVMPWILKNRQGLSVLIHPLSGHDYTDHAEHAIWIGEKLILNLEMLKD